LSIVWPCGLDVSAYLARGRQVDYVDVEGKSISRLNRCTPI
jgi:hypothetical protein